MTKKRRTTRKRSQRGGVKLGSNILLNPPIQFRDVNTGLPYVRRRPNPLQTGGMYIMPSLPSVSLNNKILPKLPVRILKERGYI